MGEKSNIFKLFSILGNISLKDSYYIARNKKICAYWSKKVNTQYNFGDKLNPIILKYLFDKPVVHSERVINFFHKPTIIFIGSILGNLKGSEYIIMGAGFKRDSQKIKFKHKKIIAVRGPLTRKTLIKNNIDCPKIYCDPVLLLSEIFPYKNYLKVWDLGIIPHYVDKEYLKAIRIKDYGLKYKIIDVFSSIDDIVEDIKKCKYIVSSSLHGIVAAHSYSIPTTRMVISDKIKGGDYKFNDYYGSMGEKAHNVYKISGCLDLMECISLAKSYRIDENIIKFKHAFNEYFEI